VTPACIDAVDPVAEAIDETVVSDPPRFDDGARQSGDGEDESGQQERLPSVDGGDGRARGGPEGGGEQKRDERAGSHSHRPRPGAGGTGAGARREEGGETASASGASETTNDAACGAMPVATR
jgi:hypothetical protein